MKKLLFLLVAVRTLFAVGPEEKYSCAACKETKSCNETYLYAELFGGPNFVQTAKNNGVQPHYHVGYVAWSAFGYHWLHGLSLEAEFAYRRNILSSLWYYGASFSPKGYYQSCSYMGNFIWDIPAGAWHCYFQPFLGVGIGYDVQHLRAHDEDFIWKRYDKGFAWQLMGGFGYSLPLNMELAIEYKFHKGPLSDVYNHSLGLSFTYKFWCKQQ